MTHRRLNDLNSERPYLDSASITPASAAGNNQAHSPSGERAAAATTQHTKTPMSSWRDAVSRPVSPVINGWVREFVSISDSTAFVKLPVMTAVEGATGKVKRRRAN